MKFCQTPIQLAQFIRLLLGSHSLASYACCCFKTMDPKNWPKYIKISNVYFFFHYHALKLKGKKLFIFWFFFDIVRDKMLYLLPSTSCPYNLFPSFWRSVLAASCAFFDAVHGGYRAYKPCHVPHASRITTSGAIFTEICFGVPWE